MVAKEHGYMPHTWDIIPKKSKAEAMAVSIIDKMISSYRYDKGEEARAN